MKKLLLFVALLFVFVIPPVVALAEDSGSTSANGLPSADSAGLRQASSQSAGSEQAGQAPAPMTTNYTLPYPGILPDNPLYVFKTLRDSIVVFFISDPLKKSEFYLLQSDKRIAAALGLIQEGQGKNALALSTLSKSTNYFDLAVGQVRLAKSSGENTSALQGQLADSVAQHINVVGTMEPLFAKSNKAALLQEQTRLKDLVKIVSGLGPK